MLLAHRSLSRAGSNEHCHVTSSPRVSFAQVKSHRRYQQADASAKQRPAAYGGTLVKAAGCAERMDDESNPV